MGSPWRWMVWGIRSFLRWFPDNFGTRISEVISELQMLGVKERRRAVYALVNEHRRDEDNNAYGV